MPTLNGYPDDFGSHKFSVFGHAGPTSYVQVTTGPLANGDVVKVAEASMNYFDDVHDATTDSGNFHVEPIPPAANPTPKPSAGSSAVRNTGAAKSFVLRWVSRVTATVGGQNQVAGTEAIAGTNLSGEIVRLSAVGRY